jgi:hypothetical protein
LAKLAAIFFKKIYIELDYLGNMKDEEKFNEEIPEDFVVPDWLNNVNHNLPQSVYAERMERLEIMRKQMYSHLLLPNGDWPPLARVITIKKGTFLNGETIG